MNPPHPELHIEVGHGIDGPTLRRDCRIFWEYVMSLTYSELFDSLKDFTEDLELRARLESVPNTPKIDDRLVVVRVNGQKMSVGDVTAEPNYIVLDVISS